MLPYASDHVPVRRPRATVALLVVTVLITLMVTASDRFGGRPAAGILDAVGIVPARFSPFSLLSYMFFHENIAHMLVNVFYLWVFGAGVEEAVGSARFLAWYVAAGVVGGALQCCVTRVLPADVQVMPIVGASAACAGLVGIFAVRYYRARLSFVILPFRPHVVAVVTLFLGLEIVQGIIGLVTGSGGNGVANWAHVGGFVFGLAGAEFSGLDEAGRRAYLTQDAARALAKNMPGAAIRRWEILLAREPNNATARSEMARAWLALGDVEQACLHYTRAVEANIEGNHRSEAALLYAEMREHDIRLPVANTNHLFLLGNALEEMEQYALAADTLRAATVRAPDAPATETALLKVIAIYVNRLNRAEEAKILLRLFTERYPRSQFRAIAEDLMRSASEISSSD